MADDNNTPIIIKKIKKGGHGHHGGAWKVAYADFVTAMMAFFLVMWIVGMSQADKEVIQKYFNDPLKFLEGSAQLNTGFFEGTEGSQAVSMKKQGGVTESSKAGGLTRMHLLAQDIEAGFKPFKNEIYNLKIFPDKIQFAISAQSIFSPGSALLKREAEPLLNRIASVLKNIDAYFMIEAHTDDLKTDNPEFPSNWELSASRASTVVRYFIEAHYFDPSRLTAMGAGQYRPVADNSTPEGRAQNRRIDIYVIPFGGDRSSIRSPASEGRPPYK
jgi:chemotaxis protein MotB